MELRDAAGRGIVRLEPDSAANGQRLKITSVLTGDVQYVDALMLETLTWIPDELLSAGRVTRSEEE
ncbi:hypothetical protein [Streptomyces sp. GbtcB6]|uniref:hypothetical protein n=1 Tax=Streptomyces sp. GbtcB6 TaxID=2824751 RepID=UPI001C2F8CA9|nr:hypothetical protein [Streptomyces sp. GbtcB6]